MALVVGGGVLASCGRSGSPASALAHTGPIQVVAAENFWGSIATQVGGARAQVRSLISDPSADPHQFEVSSADARLFAQASLVIANGAGYDDWAARLLRANPAPHRLVLNVAALVGKTPRDNPHLWYSLEFARRAANQITADYQAIDPSDAAYFADRREQFVSALVELAKIQDGIRSRFAGTKVASTEPIVVYLFRSLDLELISPAGFMQAVSDGTDPAAADVATFLDQITNGTAKVLAYNSQTATAVTTNVKEIAQAHHVPVVGFTETIQPPTLSYQDWMAAQLHALSAALASAST